MRFPLAFQKRDISKTAEHSEAQAVGTQVVTKILENVDREIENIESTLNRPSSSKSQNKRSSSRESFSGSFEWVGESNQDSPVIIQSEGGVSRMEDVRSIEGDVASQDSLQCSFKDLSLIKNAESQTEGKMLYVPLAKDYSKWKRKKERVMVGCGL
ncbi:hypothetical protein ROZALSC1DRAFT_28808, partial [Rozella allomycis CSF55]